MTRSPVFPYLPKQGIAWSDMQKLLGECMLGRKKDGMMCSQSTVDEVFPAFWTPAVFAICACPLARSQTQQSSIQPTCMELLC